MLTKIIITKIETTNQTDKFGNAILKSIPDFSCMAKIGVLSDEKRATLGMIDRQMLSCLVNYTNIVKNSNVVIESGVYVGKYSIVNQKVTQRKTMLYLEATKNVGC